MTIHIYYIYIYYIAMFYYFLYWLSVDNVDTSVDPSILSPVPNVSSRSIGVTRRGDKWVTFVASQGIVAPVLERFGCY